MSLLLTIKVLPIIPLLTIRKKIISSSVERVNVMIDTSLFIAK